MSGTGGALAVVQARMSSTRLPGKTLADLEGEPMLALLLRRLARAEQVEAVTVATSTDAADDAVAGLAQELGVGAVRGPREDVLARYLLAIGDRSGPVVRITGDCPLVDPGLVDETLECFSSVEGCAYASNIEPRTFPDGLDVEVIDAEALREVAAEPLSATEREHVTTAIRTQPQRFPRQSLVSEEDLGDLRWTVDDAEDLEFIRKLVRRLGNRRARAGMAEILAAVRREPSLASLHGRRG